MKINPVDAAHMVEELAKILPVRALAVKDCRELIGAAHAREPGAE